MALETMSKEVLLKEEHRLTQELLQLNREAEDNKKKLLEAAVAEAKLKFVEELKLARDLIARMGYTATVEAGAAVDNPAERTFNAKLIVKTKPSDRYLNFEMSKELPFSGDMFDLDNATKTVDKQKLVLERTLLTVQKELQERS